MSQANEPAVDAPKVFVVDDDPSLCRSLARLIRSVGWNVETFASAQDFLGREAYEGTGCLLVDVQMPGMSGPELQRLINDRGVALPVVFLTGHGDLPTGVQAMKRGAIDFLTKPVDDETLLATLGRGFEACAVEQSRRRQRQEIDDRIGCLSRREIEVLNLVLRGKLNKQIAGAMGISLKTVKVHRARVMQKMQADSLAELVHLCEKAGMANVEESPDPGSSGRESAGNTRRAAPRAAEETRQSKSSSASKPGPR